MKHVVLKFRRRFVYGAIASLVVLAAIAFLPHMFCSEAIVGMKGVTTSENPGLPYYDVRLEDNVTAKMTMEAGRAKSGTTSSEKLEVRQGMRGGEEALRQRIPTVVVEYNDDLRVPEVISTDVFTFTSLKDTGIPANKRHAEAVRSFLLENNRLFGLGDSQIHGLKVVADYTNPDGNLSYVDLGQVINGIDVFRGEVRAGITKSGQIFRLINNLAPGLDYNAISKDFGRPEDAVFAAAGYINHQATLDDVSQIGSKFDGNMIEFDRGQFADPTTAEKMYFPLEAGVAVPAWRVLIYESVAAYYVVVDTEGRMLWRKNIVNDQSQSASYTVYDSDSPAPLSPTTALPGANFQAPAVPRVAFSFIGNEPPNLGMNNLGWITDGTNGVNGHTDGNNGEAGLDIVAPDGVDAPVPGVNRVFNFTYNPAPGIPGPGEDPTLANFRNGMVVNMFYWGNLYHDILYGVGFTELARNFQNDNFGRGGIANDRLRLEGQDSSGTNNANMLTGADGVRGRAQMFRFTGPVPNRDSGLDQDVFIHELTHGTSNRLIGNSTGLGNNRGGSMGEGWGDFFGRVLTSTASEDVNGVFTTGGWITLQFAGQAYTNNYYYGIRRFPYTVITNVGGPLNRPHNPLTFADIDPAQINVTDGAFAPTTLPISTSATEVHNAGEVWCMNLLEVRARIITRLGFVAGNQRMLQLVTDGMKMTATSPTFTVARDAILAASLALGGTDTADIWAGFAARGQGFGSSDSNANSVVVQSFNLPNAFVVDPFSVSDVPGDGDGFPEPGENVLLSVSVTNTTGNTVNNVMAAVTGGGTGDYGSIANGATVSRQIPYTVPGAAACGSLHQVTITVSSSVGMNSPVNRSFRLGVPVGGAPATFTSSTVINIPAGQPASTSGPSSPYPSNIAVTGLTGNKIITLEITGITHTFPGDLDYLLVGPGGQKYIFLSDSGSTGDVSNLTFTLNDAAAAQPSTTQWVTGTFRPYNTGANDAFVAPAPVGPYLNAAPAATDTFSSSFGANGATMNGMWSLYLVDDATGDFGTQAGWKLTFDANDYACSVGPPYRPIADFDGDGKTDLSVFRPTNGTWYVQQSMAGPLTQSFGLSTDKIVPGDFDGDGKADIAVFRENPDPTMNFWYLFKSSTGTIQIQEWGQQFDLPQLGDFDGDNKTDFAIFRPGTREWWVLRSSDGVPTVQIWGASGDIPVVTYFDGDNKVDLTVFRPATAEWFVLRSTDASFFTRQYGSTGDKIVAGDYNGDGKTDFAVFRPSNNTWYTTLDLATNYGATVWGTAGDVVAPGDYDGDAKLDIAVFRPSNGTWYIRRSSDGMTSTQAFGTSGDLAVPNVFTR